MEPTPFLRIIAAVLFALLALVLSFSVWGQGTTGSGAAFEGRPAMAGAQGGIGAQAGPPQGGIGVQGSDAAQLRLGRPSIVDTPRDAAKGLPSLPPGGASVDRPSGSELKPPRDSGVAREEQSVTRKAQRAAKRAVDRNTRKPRSADGAPLSVN